jgi:predicted membrane protein
VSPSKTTTFAIIGAAAGALCAGNFSKYRERIDSDGLASFEGGRAGEAPASS